MEWIVARSARKATAPKLCPHMLRRRWLPVLSRGNGTSRPKIFTTKTSRRGGQLDPARVSATVWPGHRGCGAEYNNYR